LHDNISELYGCPGQFIASDNFRLKFQDLRSLAKLAIFMEITSEIFFLPTEHLSGFLPDENFEFAAFTA
jgi:hypothetical protein